MTDELSVEDQRSSRFLIATLALLAVAAFLLVAPFLTGVVFALVLGFLLQRPYRVALRVVRYPTVAATLVLLGVSLLVVVPLFFVLYRLIQDVSGIVAGLSDGDGLRASMVNAMTAFGLPPETASELLDAALGRVGEIAEARILPTLGALASAAANVGVFLFLLFFLLVQGPAFLDFVRNAMPLAPERREHLLRTMGGTVRALFLGTFLVALIQGSLAALGWWFFGFPSVIFWGFVMTLLAVIPAIGPILVMLPAGLWAIMQGDLFAGIGLIVYGLVVVGFADNLTRPFIVGRTSDVHPAVVLLGTLGGLVIFGVTGFIIGPLIMSLIPPILREWEAIRPGPG